jgi:putative ABC transport system substrate-binding protein
MRKVFQVILLGSILALFIGIFTSCSNGDTNGVSNSTDGNDVKTIGIVQIMEHPSLNTIRESFIKKMADEGYHNGDNIKIDYQNAQSDQTNLKTICQKFANKN